MSITNQLYDPCTSKMHENVNRSALEYVMYPLMYSNCDKCTPELGLPSGPAHVQVKGLGNQIDLESDLKGMMNTSSKCPSSKNTTRKYEMEYLPPCQLAGHPAVPAAQPIKMASCPIPNSRFSPNK